jgi:glucose-6-phosphate isomerase
MTMETMEKMMKMMMVIMRKVLRKMIAMMKTMSHQFRANSLESTAARLLNAIAVLTN